MSLLQAVTFFSFWACGIGLSTVEQSQISISTELKKRADINCKVSANNFATDSVYWYRQKQGRALEHLVQVMSTTSAAQGTNSRITARKMLATLSSILTISSVKKEDEALYYCAGWNRSVWIKIFGEGTKLIVTSPGESFNSGFFPKPTIFLPSVPETNLHKAGTYLCLLENFFPDVIKVFWQRADDSTVLQSQQGDTMKTNDTYMKFSWLTVTGDSMTKEHKCIVRHEANDGADQQILFRPIKQAVPIDSEPCFKHATGSLRLQFTSTSAYYTYLLLLLKSALHGALVVFFLLRGLGVCYNQKTS